MSTLVVLAHPDLQKSRVNKALKESISHKGAVFSQLYQKYPDFKIDVAAEQQLLTQAERIVFQFPIFWYSYPPLFKKYLDDVLAYGFAYGSNGKALHSKEFSLAVSLGSPIENYTKGGSQTLLTIEDILAPLKATTLFVGGTYTGHFATFGALNLSDQDLAIHCQDYQEFVK
ncbi:general stress protein 14 [Helicobacter sp. NHP19-012]|uniref:General stress protein 14 n=1 Tax=Helicobacter gastrofelis TaxID=2849642 RepID=A0ABM7SGL9_9HELI|nr:NAD(P)H-dependent oxidoreductase [Helicobacter sp. NHP19-012]BCZ18696.1 general stress protein 14 [Helicobacter sp. NHP19-012]